MQRAGEGLDVSCRSDDADMSSFNSPIPAEDVEYEESLRIYADSVLPKFNELCKKYKCKNFI